MVRAVSPKSANRIELVATEADAGIRLDKLLAQRIDALSRARIQALIRSGNVAGSGGATIGDGSYRVKPGEMFIVKVPPPEPAAPAAEAIALDVVYEDRDLIVIDKPPHLVVHPAPGHASGTLVNALIAHCGDSLSGVGGIKRPGIVHRLDKGTSGLLVVAKSDAAHRGLSEQFAAHGADGRMHRAYLALVWGKPLRPRGVIAARLVRSQSNRTKIAVARGESGRHAVTHYEVIETIGTDAGPISLLRLELETGRTHQIRVHLAHIGHPVLGDTTYASGFKAKAGKLAPDARAALAALDRQALHAAELGFEHPRSGKKLRFVSPLPADMQGLLDALRPD
ncbi:MAG: RluA family pseudouridine synthase [Hyphomicrobium sp.]|nr:RluA family pseudouridine synthase [Hyphomicrobium sp.]